MGSTASWEGAYRTALECSEVWQWWKRSSLSALEKAYLPDMVLTGTGQKGGQGDNSRAALLQSSQVSGGINAVGDHKARSPIAPSKSLHHDSALCCWVNIGTAAHHHLNNPHTLSRSSPAGHTDTYRRRPFIPQHHRRHVRAIRPPRCAEQLPSARAPPTSQHLCSTTSPIDGNKCCRGSKDRAVGIRQAMELSCWAKDGALLGSYHEGELS